MAAILELPEFEGPEGHSISEIEIREAINKLKYGKASGVDCISTDLLKVCAGNRHMLVSLAVIFSQCLRESRNPADWQIALVKTLFKKGDRHSWKNYRLISLLSVVGKLYESVLANRLSCLLDGCDRRGDHLLSQFQGGFRRGLEYYAGPRTSIVANLVNQKRSNTRCLNARPLRKNGRHFLRDYTRFAPRHGN